MTLSFRGTRRFPQTALLGGIALAAAAALTLTGCASGASDAQGTDGALKVVATTTQLTDFAREVGGDDIELRGLLVPGGSAHHFDPTPADLLALSEADVLIVNGAGLETFIDDAIDASGFDGELVTASDGIDLAEATEITAESEAGGAAERDHAAESAEDHADHDHEAETTEEAEAEAAEAEAAETTHADEDEHADHDHGATNPHLWTAPRYAEGMAAHIGSELARIDPAHAAGYEDRTAAYVQQLTALDAWVSEQFAAVPETKRVLVSGHDSLSYFLHDYDIAFAGAILPSFEDNAEPSAADIDALVAAIKERGVTAVFVESSMSPKLARTIAAEAGVRVIDAESLYADSLGVADSGADTYISATIQNTRVILEAWGESVGPVPATLQ